MKSNSIVVGVVLLGAVALSTYSQTAAPKPALTVKIAVVALRDAMLATQEGRKAAQQMQGKYGPQRAALEKLQNEIAGGEDQLRKGGATMSAEAQNKLAGELTAKKKRLQRDGDDLEAEMEQEENRLVQEITGKMGTVIDQFAKQNGYTMVMDAANPVLWAAESANVTPEIVRLYDQAHPSAAAPAAAGKKQ